MFLLQPRSARAIFRCCWDRIVYDLKLAVILAQNIVTCLLDGTANDIADDRVWFPLTKSHNSGYCLRLYHRIPLRLKDVNFVCDREVEAT